MKKNLILLAIAIVLPNSIRAQETLSHEEAYRIFVNEIKEKYYSFRDSCNQAYADAIRGEWKSQTAEKAVQKPKDEKFTPLKVELPADNAAKPTNSLLKVNEYAAPAKAKPQPSPKDIDNLPTNKPVYAYDNGEEVVFMVEGHEIPTDAVVELGKKNSWLKSLFSKKKADQKDKKKKKKSSKEKAEPIEPYHAFTFYGTEYKVRLEPKHLSFRLMNVYPETIAKQWERFSVKLGKTVEQAEKSRCTNLLYDCLMLRKEYDLCDWAYLNMLYQMSASFLGKGTNEATFLTAFLYCQSGYKIRMASNRQGKLYILVASDHYIYDNPPFNIDGTRYFAFLPEEGDNAVPTASLNLNICQAAFKDEQALSLLIPHAPKLDVIKTNARELASLHNKEMKALVSTNKNRVDFFNNYPSSYVDGNFMTRWAMYANTPLSEEVKTEFYPSLKESIQGCSKAKAVSILLEFCQSAFEYKFDEEVWGGDRAFFAEETLYYPYSDCEDRSILFSRLVRDLVGLDVLLVYYPGHLLTAVHFPEDAQLAEELRGEYFSLPCDGRNFVICDPTGLYAPIGWNNETYKNEVANVILLE